MIHTSEGVTERIRSEQHSRSARGQRLACDVQARHVEEFDVDGGAFGGRFLGVACALWW